VAGRSECLASFILPVAPLFAKGRAHRVLPFVFRFDAGSFRWRNTNQYCGRLHSSIHFPDDSGLEVGQQVVCGKTTPRHLRRTCGAANGSTWQGRASPSVASFPCAALCRSGNRARFRTFGGARMRPADDTTPVRKPPKRGAKGGRVRLISFRADAAEFLLIDENAHTMGMSRGSYLRACALGSPGPRARRAPHVNAEALARATAALNKVGSNLNQLARVFNSARTTVAAHECSAALTETRSAVCRILEIVGRKDHL
jgi:hypothetical protein